MPTSAELLQQGRDTEDAIEDLITNTPADAKNPEDSRKYNREAEPSSRGIEEKGNILQQTMENREEMIDQLSHASSDREVFNILKEAQMAAPDEETWGMDDPVAAPPEEEKVVIFRDAAVLREWLLGQRDVDKALGYLKSLASSEYQIEPDGNIHNPQQTVDDYTKRFMESRGTTEFTEQRQLEMASAIFNALPSAITGDGQDGENLVPVKEVAAKIVEESEQIIKNLASDFVQNRKASSKSFNLSKQAQHKSFENALMWGPGNRIDPFLAKAPGLANDWHRVERNKGFGLVIDDVTDLDWETIWRGNIMDKYSRPYRDKDGNWVGGYINKRFEVEQWIPEGNDLQLKPGQRRRPRLPQHGLTEARLEHSRDTEDRGYAPDSQGDPTDWNENGYAHVSLASKSFNLKKKAKKTYFSSKHTPQSWEEANKKKV